MKSLAFDSSRISDQKRYVRGEQLLLSRTLLRARDGVHHAKWRILMMAGGSPRGELNALRELMPKAYVLAVDTDSRCLEAAIDAGADDVVLCDILEQCWAERERPHTSPKRIPPKPLRDRSKFDLFHLDLCGGVTSELVTMVSFYMRTMVEWAGVFIVTFSYGRDVAERYLGLGRSWGTQADGSIRELPSDCSDAVSGRIMFLTRRSQNVLNSLRSIMVYRGAEMPMCSLLFQYGRHHSSCSFVKVEPGDFELAVSYPTAANLYDCPQERIESLRRQFAAIKASLTRKEAEVGRDMLFA